MQVYTIKTLYNLRHPLSKVSSNIELFVLKKDANNRMSELISDVESEISDLDRFEVTHYESGDVEFYGLNDYHEDNFITFILCIQEVL